ncbi:MAG: TlpA family protein disulfide reductase, partial [Actinobacteria bacterium]
MWRELRDELHPGGFELVTIALDIGGIDAAGPFIERAQPTHPSLVDDRHALDELFGVVNVPSGIWIDEEGMIVRPPEPAWPGRSVVSKIITGEM